MKFKKTIAYVFVFLILSPTSALALTESNTQDSLGNSATQPTQAVTTQDAQEKFKDRMEEAKAKQEERQAQRKEAWAQRCDNIEERIEFRLERYKANKQTHIDRYNQIKELVQNVISRFKQTGLDTSTLESMIATHDQMVRDWATEYDEFITLLSKSQDYVCGESEGAFKEKLQESREKLLSARKLRLAAREYFYSTVRVELSRLREELKSQQSTTNTQ